MTDKTLKSEPKEALLNLRFSSELSNYCGETRKRTDEEFYHISPQILDRGAWQSGTTVVSCVIVETQEQNPAVYQG